MASELFHLAVLLLACCGEAIRFKREMHETQDHKAQDIVRENDVAAPCWKLLMIRIFVILAALGGPVHYFTQLAHGLSELI